MSDSGNILDNAEVEFLLDAAAPEDAAASTEKSEAPEQTVTMRGNLDQINLADIFQTLAMTKMEGVLRVHNPLEQRHVYCSDGFVRILTPPRVIQRRIGQRLVQAGLITSDQLRSALMRQRKDRIQLGKMLIDDGLITAEQIEDIASVQVAEDLFSLFTWRYGTFEFYRGEVTDQALRQRFETCPEFEVSSLLLEVARRSDEWESILDAIGNLDELPIVTAEQAPRELTDIEYALYRGADGLNTYRQLAEQTTQGLFEVARVARNLVHEGLLANVADEQMVTTAQAFADQGNPKQAVMVLQTLRDRATDLGLEVVRGIAAVLEGAGERKLAGLTLLEVAQQQTDPQLALSMARDACEFAPHDPTTLAFLRTTLLAQGGEAQEIETCTVNLIDALVGEERVTEAIAIVEEARSAGCCSPAVLQREARLRQKNKDTAGAIEVFEEVAGLYRGLGDTAKVRESYEAILRLDRSRKDIQRLLQKMQQTRSTKILRFAAGAIAVGLLGSMGLVLWQAQRFEAAVRAAGSEITEFIRTGDRVAARQRLAHWSGVLEDCQELEDLRRQVDFADAAELQRQTRLAQRHMNEQLVSAAEMLDRGELRSALSVYAKLRATPDLRAEVDEVISTRFEAVLSDIEETAKTMATRLPTEPAKMMDRRELTTRLADVQSLCRPTLYVLVDDIATLYDNEELPDFLPELLRTEVGEVLNRVREVYARARKVSEAYSEAVRASDTQRRYDPIFKEALGREQAHDFAGALELFRELQKAEVNDPELRTLFRDHVTRNATICKLMEKLAEGTAAGDHEAATQQLKALELAFAEVPFQRLVRLPLRIETQPPGAKIECNGTEVGFTPCTVAYIPANPNRVVVELPGFRRQETEIEGGHNGLMHLRLVYQPMFEFEYENAVDVSPTSDPSGRTFLVDRGGNVTALVPGTPQPSWSFKSGDLSGLLSRVFRYGGQVVFASLDGHLRALDAESGALVWQLPNLPTERQPAHFGQYLAIGTTDDRLVLVDLEHRSVTETALESDGRARLLAAGSRLIVVTPTEVRAYDVPGLKPLWQRPLADLAELNAAANDETIVLADDQGNVVSLDVIDGHERWRQIADGIALGPPVIDGETVLVGSARRLTRFQLLDGGGRRALGGDSADWTGAPVQIGNRLLMPTGAGAIDVLDILTGKRLYVLEGNQRGVRLLPWRRGLVVALNDRRLQFYPSLR